MTRFRAEAAKRKPDPLVENGRRVTVFYNNQRAFETRKIEVLGGSRTWSYERARVPSKELLSWMERHSGPRGILWTTVKRDDDEGIDIYFAVPGQALMFKLAWGGR